MRTFKTDYQIPKGQQVTIDDGALTVDLSDDATIQNSFKIFILIKIIFFPSLEESNDECLKILKKIF